MRPAIRSTFDVVSWLQSQAEQTEIDLSPSVLMKLLYLSQAVFAAENKKAKLIPATFLATDVGPIEPDLFIALEQGIAVDGAVDPSPAVEEVLGGVWESYSGMTDEMLSDILNNDVAIKTARQKGRNSEILIEDMVSAYPGGLKALLGMSQVSTFPDGSPYNVDHSNLEAAPPASQEVRFTADGRSVTRWVPKKRMRSKDLKK
ncbi:hypothetical protein [Sneathiella limimaris]|uniref:hypothetical protein n=1 Tax=Sneathiella limimaris TaxID=1964213 RepID=UPI001469EC66|nr:hypothetical protein [Sneathiella limimaris]